MCTSPDEGLRTGQSGVTLVESIVALVIIGTALAGTLQLMSFATAHSADPMVRSQAVAIAEAYLEEISLKSFFDPDLGPGPGPCPAPEARRDLYDNVCDYAGIDDPDPEDQNGNPVAGLAGFRVRVAVDSAATLGGLSGPVDLLRVDVRVNLGNATDLTLSSYRTAR